MVSENIPHFYGFAINSTIKYNSINIDVIP